MARAASMEKLKVSDIVFRHRMTQAIMSIQQVKADVGSVEISLSIPSSKQQTHRPFTIIKHQDHVKPIAEYVLALAELGWDINNPLFFSKDYATAVNKGLRLPARAISEMMTDRIRKLAEAAGYGSLFFSSHCARKGGWLVRAIGARSQGGPAVDLSNLAKNSGQWQGSGSAVRAYHDTMYIELAVTISENGALSEFTELPVSEVHSIILHPSIPERPSFFMDFESDKSAKLRTLVGIPPETVKTALEKLVQGRGKNDELSKLRETEVRYMWNQTRQKTPLKLKFFTDIYDRECTKNGHSTDKVMTRAVWAWRRLFSAGVVDWSKDVLTTQDAVKIDEWLWMYWGQTEAAWINTPPHGEAKMHRSYIIQQTMPTHVTVEFASQAEIAKKLAEHKPTSTTVKIGTLKPTNQHFLFFLPQNLRRAPWTAQFALTAFDFVGTQPFLKAWSYTNLDAYTLDRQLARNNQEHSMQNPAALSQTNAVHIDEDYLTGPLLEISDSDED